jgi:hypothetical protein
MRMLKSRWVRWFLWSGGIGLVMPFIMWLINPSDPTITLILCPTSIAGLAEPKDRLGMAVLYLIIFGGNFLLYGTVGAVASFIGEGHARSIGPRN